MFIQSVNQAKGGGGGVLLEMLGGGVPFLSPNPDPISNQKCVVFHTRCQTRTLKCMPVFRPGVLAEIMLSSLRLERKHKNSSNPFRIRIFVFLSFSLGIEMINTFIHSVAPSKTIPDSRPKWAKCIPVFRLKRPKNPTRWGDTYIYGLYKGVPPPPGVLNAFKSLHEPRPQGLRKKPWGRGMSLHLSAVELQRIVNQKGLPTGDGLVR